MLVMGDITVVGDSWDQLPFKNCWPFIMCITKGDGTTIDDAEDLDLVMPMYIQLKLFLQDREFMVLFQRWSKNFNADIDNANVFKSFEYKSKLLGDMVAQPTPNNNFGILKNTTIAIPLKYKEYLETT